MRARRLAASLSLVLSLALAAACTPAGPKPSRGPGGVTRAPGLPAEQPVVRVGLLVDTTEVEVDADASYTLSSGDSRLASARSGERWTFASDASGSLVGHSDRGGRIGPVQGPIAIAVQGDAPLRIGEHPYHGSALIVAAEPGHVTAVNVVDLERYLLGVVPSEIPPIAVEAVKAQAVAARTYAIGNLGSRDQLGFDFFATVADQVYGGVAREDTMASRAVRETRGEIITYGGAPILAYYHSTCGGRTAAIDQVWRRPPQPYLQSVSDAKPGGGYYCDISSRFDWHEQWTADALDRIVGRVLASQFGVTPGAARPVTAIEVESRTTSGRVGVLRLEAGGRTYRVRGDSIRWILRPEESRILNSILFDITSEHRGGSVRGLRVDGHGWGHGIGMCQMGAIGRAKAGQSYRQILRTYYTGTEIARLY